MNGTGAATRRERARREMREAILDAARRLITAEGLSGPSIRAIAREIGYSPAALYEYFPAKEDVGRALFFEGAEGLTGMMERALAEVPAGAGPAEELQALSRLSGYALQNPELFRLVFTSSTVGFTPDADELGRSRGGYDCLVETARRGIEAGLLHDYRRRCWRRPAGRRCTGS